MKQLDAKQLGVNPRTKIIDYGAFIAIVIERKSRIIMKDGEKIIEKAKVIQKVKNTPIFNRHTSFLASATCAKHKKRPLSVPLITCSYYSMCVYRETYA